MAVNLHRKLRAFCLVMLMLLLQPGAWGLYAQLTVFDSAYNEEASRIREELQCFTDRSFYVTEELVRFSAFVRTDGLSESQGWSSVLYVELINAQGSSLTGGKYRIQGGRAHGELMIPAHIKSGNYYLRSYTRWLRNHGPEFYNYVPLTIVNPQRSELEEGIPEDDAELQLTQVSLKEIQVELNEHGEIWQGSESLNMQITLPSRLPAFLGCITVVPRHAFPRNGHSELKPVRQAHGDPSADAFQLAYLPDKYGPTISGSVIPSRGNGGNLSDTRVHLTLMGEASDYLVSRADAGGRFSMALPFGEGEQDLFVQARSADGSSVVVRIDREFDQRQLSLPAPGLDLTAEQRQFATIWARNIQLQKIYGEKAPVMGEDSLQSDVPFYGLPTLSVDLDRFVLLPTLEEVFINLVPGVSLVKRRRGTSLEIQSTNPMLSMFEPLIMVDEVPVFDLDKFIKLSPSKIRRIDVVDDVYVKGDMRYGGLINLQSREGDMAGIDLPGNAFFLDYQSISPASGGPEDLSLQQGRVPDMRNTVIWVPEVALGPTETLTLTFTAPAFPGEYLLLLRGIDQEGESVVAEYAFEVLERK